MRNHNRRNKLKIKLNELKKLVRSQLIKEGFADDVGKFRDDYTNYSTKLKEKASKLKERQLQMKAVKLINNRIGKLVSELKKLQGGKVLETVKKSHANKYNKSITMLEDILEGTTGWLKENK